MSKGKHLCDNCGHVWLQIELDDISDFWARVEPGGTVPSGQCPDTDCASLCYPLTRPPCTECDRDFDDNPGQTVCKTCEEWMVTEGNFVAPPY